MFIRWDDPVSVRLTGRWSKPLPFDYKIFVQSDPSFTTTTTAGAYFELAFEGEMALLQFDLGYCGQPYPHLWIELDGGARIEAPVDRYLRVVAPSAGKHILKVTYKGGMEMLPRWYQPLMGAISFKGAEVAAAAELPKDDRKIIEFIGDSITEGVLIDADFSETSPNVLDQFNRPYQDDNCATYAALLSEALNLRPTFQAYGAIGMTRSGCGSVPRAGLIYPYVYDGIPFEGEEPDYIMINHGANDRRAPVEEYLARYKEFLDMVRKMHPNAKIICLGAFCGAFDAELREFVKQYSDDKVWFVSSNGWVPLEPLHPLRDGHKTIAEHLVPIMKEIMEA